LARSHGRGSDPIPLHASGLTLWLVSPLLDRPPARKTMIIATAALAAVHLSITAAYWMVLWVVQLVIYPQFLRVPGDAFAAYHREHCRRMGWVVAPLFAAEGITALALAWSLWADQPYWQGASIGLFLLGHGITFAVFVPLHRRWENGPVPRGDLQKAVRLNWLRVAVGTARLAAVAGAFAVYFL